MREDNKNEKAEAPEEPADIQIMQEILAVLNKNKVPPVNALGILRLCEHSVLNKVKADAQKAEAEAAAAKLKMVKKNAENN